MRKKKKQLKKKPILKIKGNGKKGLNKNNKDKLTRDVIRQKLFVAEFVKDFNATRAAIAAGYAKTTAKHSADDILAIPGVYNAITKALTEKLEKLGIEREDIVRDLITIKQRCMQEIECLDMFGNPTGIWRFDSKGALKALELLGKHLMMFPTNVKHSNDPENPLPNASVVVYVPDNGRPAQPKPADNTAPPTSETKPAESSGK